MADTLGPDTPIPQLEYSWTALSIDGNALKFHGAVQSRWVQDRLSDEVPIKSPTLRTWVQLPEGYKIESLEESDFKVHKNPLDTPFTGPDAWKKAVVSLDSVAPEAHVLIGVSKPGTKTVYLKFTRKATFEKPMLLFDDDSCTREGISLGKSRNEGHFMFIAAVCVDHGEFLDLWIFHSTDADFLESDLPDKDNSGPVYQKFKIRKTKEAGSASSVLGFFRIGELHGKGESLHVVFYEPPWKKGPLRFTFGLGTTLLDYSEEVSQRRLFEFSPTVKGGLDVRLHGSKLDMGVNGYFTLLPLKVTSESSPPGIAPVRFYGINGRLGMRLPNAAGTSDLRLLTGWYFWGMLVPDRSFGVRSLQGPQIFLMARTFQLYRRSFFAYFKFAPIAEQIGTISLSDRELAFGTGYQINNPRETSSVMLTADISDARFHSNLEHNGLKLITYTLGISVSP